MLHIQFSTQRVLGSSFKCLVAAESPQTLERPSSRAHNFPPGPFQAFLIYSSTSSRSSLGFSMALSTCVSTLNPSLQSFRDLLRSDHHWCEWKPRRDCSFLGGKLVSRSPPEFQGNLTARLTCDPTFGHRNQFFGEERVARRLLHVGPLTTALLKHQKPAKEV